MGPDSDSYLDQSSSPSTEDSTSVRNRSSSILGIVAPAAIACPPPTPPCWAARVCRVLPRFTPFSTSRSVALVETFASPESVTVVTIVTLSPKRFDEETRRRRLRSYFHRLRHYHLL